MSKQKAVHHRRSQSGSLLSNAAVAVLLLGFAAVIFAAVIGDDRGGAAARESLDPCRAPLAWHIGSVDPRFGISRAQVQQAVEEATGVWEGSSTGRFFTHADAYGMPINLVYDQRQETVNRFKALGLRLDELAAQVEADRAAYERLRSASAGATYRRSVDRYNEAVQQNNSARAGAIEEVGRLHRREVTRNGRLVRVNRELTVFAFGSHAELSLILAHELGHALGLDHVAPAGSIMSLNYRDSEVDAPIRLRPADRAALTRACGPGN